MTDTAPPTLNGDTALTRAGAALFPLLMALALTVIVAIAIRAADVAGLAMAEMWRDLVLPAPHALAVPGAIGALGAAGVPPAAQTTLGPVIAALGAAAALSAIYAGLVRLQLLDDIRDTPLALGLVARDLPFLVAGLVFMALYASLADGLARAAGLAVPPAPTDPLTVLALVLVVPLAQELLLRGGLMPSLERHTGLAASIVLTALAGLPAVTPVPELIALALVPQLFFGWMAWSCRSLGAAAVLHAAYILIRFALAG